MSAEQLEKLSGEAKKNPKHSWAYVQFLEDNNIDRPRDVMEFGKQSLDNKSVPQNKRWRLLERVAISGMQCDNISLANECLNELSKSFGENSKRIKLLRAMMLEKQEDWNKSELTYNQILKEDSNYSNALKRKIALLLSQRSEKAAIHKLNEYLSLYCNDMYAWKELMNLYLKQHNYELAKFACEELFMLPTQSKENIGEVTIGGEDYMLHLLYAEICYNIGSMNEVQLAIKHFSQSIILGGDNNVRALYGLVLSLRTVKELAGSGSDDDRESKRESEDAKSTSTTSAGEPWLKRLSHDEKELLNISLQKIVKVYADKKSPLLNLAKEVLLQFTPTS